MKYVTSMRSAVTTLGDQFSEQEAWTLFRLAAFGEAVGWSLLIGGICLSRFVLGGNHDPITIAGQLHGMLFMIYLAACTVLASSLRWSWRRSVIALAFSIPPYGSLLFERWTAVMRRLQQSHDWRQTRVWAIIFKGDQVLAAQLANGTSWQLPGGAVTGSDNVETALEQLLVKQVGVNPVVGQLRYVRQHVLKGQPTIDLYFVITNPTAFTTVSATKNSNIDELRFIDPLTTADLQPEFLRNLRPQSVSRPEFL